VLVDIEGAKHLWLPNIKLRSDYTVSKKHPQHFRL